MVVVRLGAPGSEPWWSWLMSSICLDVQCSLPCGRCHPLSGLQPQSKASTGHFGKKYNTIIKAYCRKILNKENLPKKTQKKITIFAKVGWNILQTRLFTLCLSYKIPYSFCCWLLKQVDAVCTGAITPSFLCPHSTSFLCSVHETCNYNPLPWGHPTLRR